MGFRKQVKICQTVFDIDQVEGGKLRASSIKLPGFELIAISHSELRRQMQKALYDYDRAQLLKPAGEDMAQQGQGQALRGIAPSPYAHAPNPPTPAGLRPNLPVSAGSGFAVYVDENGFLHSFNCALDQFDGVAASQSEYGLDYRKLGFRSATAGIALRAFEAAVNDAHKLGATDIIWREKPRLEQLMSGDWQVCARLHYLPQIINNQLSWWQFGSAAPRV